MYLKTLKLRNTVKLLNVQTLGLTKSDYINQMITITGLFFLVNF